MISKKKNTNLILLGLAAGIAFYFRKDLKKIFNFSSGGGYTGGGSTGGGSTGGGGGSTGGGSKLDTIEKIPAVLIKQLQKILNVTPDGVLTPQTKAALKLYISTPPTLKNIISIITLVGLTKKSVRKLGSIQDAPKNVKIYTINSIRTEYMKYGADKFQQFLAPAFLKYTKKNLTDVFPSAAGGYTLSNTATKI